MNRFRYFLNPRFAMAVIALLAGVAGVPVQAQENFLPDAAATGAEKPESIKYTLIRPGDKAVETVKEGERNPYGKSGQVVQNLDAKSNSEENDIRDRLLKLRVVGVSPGLRGLRVMLGDMVLEPGEEVPQVLPEQSQALRVGTISSRAIELVWVEKKPSGLPPRVLTIPVDLRPYVRSVLKGQANAVNQWEKEKPETNRGVVATQFPEVAQTSAQMPSQLAQNDRASLKSPAPIPPAAGATPASSPHEEAGRGPAAEGFTLPPLPDWQEAMSLLKKLVPLGGGGDKP